MWLPPSRKIRLLCPVLEGMGVCYHLLPLYLSDIPTSKDSIWRQLETLRRHGGAGGAWQWSFVFFTSLAFLGWLNKACIFCASLLQLGTPGTANNSLHQSGVSVVSAFHVTHLQSSHTGSSGGGPSSSELSTDPLRKEVTPSFNSGSFPNSKSSAVASTSPDSGLSQGGWQGAELLVNHTWQCLLLHSVAPCIWWSLLFDLALTSN